MEGGVVGVWLGEGEEDKGEEERVEVGAVVPCSASACFWRGGTVTMASPHEEVRAVWAGGLLGL